MNNTLSEKTLRYNDKGNVHMDFHGATNTTIEFIIKKYGVNIMNDILKPLLSLGPSWSKIQKNKHGWVLPVPLGKYKNQLQSIWGVSACHDRIPIIEPVRQAPLSGIKNVIAVGAEKPYFASIAAVVGPTASHV